MIQRTVAGGHPRVPRHRVRRLQARSPAGQAVRADRRAGPGDPLRRRRAAHAGPARRLGLGAAQGPGPQGGPADRRRADQAVRRPAGHQGPRLLARTPRGSASSRTRSPTSRPPTSWPASTRSSATWSSRVPMDRLICGDVGYGKTEIAVRAAFKAVQDGKQVAVLVPTTLLVQQHLQTFTERFAGFPVNVRALEPVPDRRRGQRGRRRLRGRHGRRRHRDPPAVQPGDQVQGPRAGGRRRGAALRRRAQGSAEADAHRGRRTQHVRDADPADARDGRDRHPRDVDDHHAARGAAPGADVRRAAGRRAGGRCGATRAAARGPGLLHPQPGPEHRRGRRSGCASWFPRRGCAWRTASRTSTSSSR